MSITLRPILAALSLAAALGPAHPGEARPSNAHPKKSYTVDLPTQGCTFTDTGRNRFLVLEPGHQLNMAAELKAGLFEVSNTVLHDTRVIDGVRTRVVEEFETLNGELVEISLNYYALCQETGAVYFFGEHVELFDGGVVVSGEGSWEAGIGGARPGMAMPGTFFLGARYQMEVAPGIAMDRVENLEMGLSFDTPAGTFENCVRTIETTPLEPAERTVKVHAEGVGVIADDVLRLVSWRPSPLTER